MTYPNRDALKDIYKVASRLSGEETRKILSYLIETGTCNPAQIVSATNVDYRSVGSALKGMADLGLLSFEKDQHDKRKVLYTPNYQTIEAYFDQFNKLETALQLCKATDKTDSLDH